MKSNVSPAADGAWSRGPTDAAPPNRFDRLFRHSRGIGHLPGALLILMAMGGLLMGGPVCGLHETIAGDGSALPALRPQPHVEIFRGLGGYMPGSDSLQERLAARGILSTTWLDCSSHRVARRILERRAQGDEGPIVLMGYATGGGATRQVAIDLARHGICVDAIILLEPSFFEPVPRSVGYCFVAYKPEPLQMWNSLMRGNPVRIESTGTVVQRVNLKHSAPPGVLCGENHLTITANEWVQELLVEQAAAVFGLDRAERQGPTVGCDETTADGSTKLLPSRKD
jgi:hypothetical protein